MLSKCRPEDGCETEALEVAGLPTGLPQPKKGRFTVAGLRSDQAVVREVAISVAGVWEEDAGVVLG